jgi:hypothetical protein
MSRVALHPKQCPRDDAVKIVARGVDKDDKAAT